MLFRDPARQSGSRTIVTAFILVTLLAAPARAAASTNNPAPPGDLAQPTRALAVPEQFDSATVRVSPKTLTVVARAGHQREQTVRLTNAGPAPVTWQLADGRGRAVPATPAGAILASWPTTDVAIGWGIGTESGNVWISDVDLLRNDSFTVDGVRRDEGWPTSWANLNPGPLDMAYVPGRALMCQVAVGVDNGIHCWDPRTGEIMAEIVGDLPWTAAPQRGLAYRPDDDTFYVGGWDQGIIYHIAGLGHRNPGSVLGQCAPADRTIAGLGWSGGFDRLWMATRSAADLIYAIDPDTCRTLATVAPPDQEPFTGGGLDVDSTGALWGVSVGTGALPGRPSLAYRVGSGLPAFADAPWLSTTLATGVLEPGVSQQVGVRVDTAGLAPGRYRATLYLLTDGPGHPPTTVPVRLVVLPEAR